MTLSLNPEDYRESELRYSEATTEYLMSLVLASPYRRSLRLPTSETVMELWVLGDY